MSERYTRVCTLPENLYTEGSPVIIAAGALLKDNQTRNVLTQLKFRSISRKTIKALKIRIYPLDTVNRPLGDPIEYDYLDLKVERNKEFGAEEPVVLPNSSTRGVGLEIVEVAFTDNSTWLSNGQKLAPLANETTLASYLLDGQLVEQYKIRYGAQAKVKPEKFENCWRCTCGEINSSEESACFKCKNRLDNLLSCDFSSLKREMEDRLLLEERRREEAYIAAEKKEKKARNTIIALLVVALIAGAGAFYYMKFFQPAQKYNEAKSLMSQGNYENAYSLLQSISEYKDVGSLLQTVKGKLFAVGNTVKLGTYEQDNNTSNGKEAIEWLVLARENNKALLISKYALDGQPYHSNDIGITWEKCSLRSWLNRTFLYVAFSTTEQEKILSSKVTAYKDSGWGTNSGNDTTDKIFLLSITEVNKYFSSDNARKCAGTKYCYAAYKYKADNGNCKWWLRSPGMYSFLAAGIENDGSFGEGGYVVNAVLAVRPALWIDLS